MSYLGSPLTQRSRAGSRREGSMVGTTGGGMEGSMDGTPGQKSGLLQPALCNRQNHVELTGGRTRELRISSNIPS